MLHYGAMEGGMNKATVTPLPQTTTFDPKKLGRLSLARTATRLESDQTRSSRWKLSADPYVRRSISLDAQVSTSSLNLDTLRKLDTSPFSKRDSLRKSAEEDSNSRGPNPEQPSKDTQDPRKVTFYPLIQRSSIRNGVGDKAIAALSELGRRRSSAAPSIVLPTNNRPFLVGEKAGSRVTSNTKPVFDDEPSFGTEMTTPSEQTRMELSTITALSKLIFFGGSTPTKGAASFTLSTPDALLLSPDESTSSQSDSFSIRESRYSYLLQLGHIMGQFSPQHAPLQSRQTDFDENAYTLSSIEHFSATAQDREIAPHHIFSFCRFLFTVLLIAGTLTFNGDNEYRNKIYAHAKETIAPFAHEALNVVRHRAEACTVNARENLCINTVDWVGKFFDVQYTSSTMLSSWYNLTMDTFVVIMGFVSEPVPLSKKLVQKENLCTIGFPWAPQDEISTDVMVSRQASLPQPAEIQQVSLNLHPDTLTAIHAIEPSNNFGSDEDVDTKSGILIEKETSTSFPEHPGLTTEIDSSSGFLVVAADKRERERSSSKDRLEAAAMNMLLKAMGTKVTAQLEAPRSTSFNLSLTAQLALRPVYGDPFDSDTRSLFPSKLIHSDPNQQYKRTRFDEIFSCVWPDVAASRYSPTSTKSICRAPEAIVDEESNTLDTINDLFPSDDDAGFLQRALTEIVSDFLRERRKRRREKRERKRARKQREE